MQGIEPGLTVSVADALSTKLPIDQKITTKMKDKQNLQSIPEPVPPSGMQQRERPLIRPTIHLVPVQKDWP